MAEDRLTPSKIRDEIAYLDFEPRRGLGPRAPLPEPDQDGVVPADLFFNLADKYARLETECAGAHREAKIAHQAADFWQSEAKHRSEEWKKSERNARRNRRAFVMATWTAAFLLLVAILEGAALWAVWPR